MSIKTTFNKALDRSVNSKFGWQIMQPVIHLSHVLEGKKKKIRKQKKEAERNKTFSPLFAEKTVLHGPFKGMIYPSFDSVGSTLFPKLIGSYERELHDIVELICHTPYTQVLDIGCAEGYYAIGLSIRMPQTKVYAYDTNEKARVLCKKMAAVNGVSDRVTVNAFCSADELGAFKFTGKGLVISDCEGFEMELFTKDNLANLLNCDVLIESHEFINIHISTYLKDLFKATHDIEIVRSIDDIEKAKTYDYTETKGMTLEAKKQLHQEERPAIMEWLFCKAKS